MAGRLTHKRPTRRDADDAVALKAAGDPAHINEREDRLLASLMPEAHGVVVTRGLLAEAGRGRDDRITRLIPAEAALLKSRGGSGAVNPRTGLLEYDDSDDDGNSGNTSNAGENTGGMDTSSPNSGVTGHEGPSSSAGGNTGSYRDDYSGFGFGGRKGKLTSAPYDPTRTPVESLLAAPNFQQPGMSFTQYSPRDTWGRVLQEYLNPSIPAPGRFGAPNKHGPGIVGTGIAQLAGGPFSAAMGIGGAMGRASSAATQAASAAEDAARSGHNSGGRNHWSDDPGFNGAAFEEMINGGPAGVPAAETVGQAPPPGYTLNAAGQIVPLAGSGGDNRPAWKDPARNLLYDYIWRGPSGRGLLGW